MRIMKIGLICLAASAATAELSQAALMTYTSRASFDAAVGPYTIEDFESYVSDAPFHTISVDVGDFVLSMTGSPSTSYNKIDLAPPDTSETNVNGTTNMRVFTDNSPAADLVITFDAPIMAFGADFRSFNDEIARTRLLVGAEIVTPPIAASSGLFSFFGFTSTTPFTTITFEGLENDVYGIDNLSYSDTVVPEPGSIAAMLSLVGCGVGAVVLRRRRTKKLAA